VFSNAKAIELNALYAQILSSHTKLPVRSIPFDILYSNQRHQHILATKMTPTTPQRSQDDVFFTPLAFRQSSIHSSSPSDESWSGGGDSVGGVPSHVGTLEANLPNTSDDLSWLSSPPTTGPTGESLLFPSREAVKDHIQTFAAAKGWTVKAASLRKNKNSEYYV
jgi:hypothetical protein